MDRLPADLLAHILRCLAPRWLAASRCVRKAWRDAVDDDGRMLNSDLLPLIPTPITSPKSSYYPCATCEYLAFDPATSPHYEVFQVNENVPRGWNGERVEAEWPSSEYALCVFSSRTCRWEVKTFVREGDAAGDLADMPHYSSAGSHYGAYWRGSLYVPQHDFVMRINSSSNTYRVTKLPKCISSPKTDTVGSSSYRLGKSKKGVYCALVVSRFKLWVWFLDETCGQMEWRLRKEINLKPLLANFPLKYAGEPWSQRKYDMRDEGTREEEPQWDSDDDTVIATQKGSKDTYSRYGVSILGFHPSKEIVFLLELTEYKVLAYHVTTSNRWNTWVNYICRPGLCLLFHLHHVG